MNENTAARNKELVSVCVVQHSSFILFILTLSEATVAGHWW